jgi:hypothetical protein
MALNYLNKELKGPVTKPTGHEPFTTHVNKLLSGAMNYRGMPVPVDTRPTFSGAAGGPKAMVTKPTAHASAFASNIPLPFHTVVYNANARHVPDLESIGTEAAKRRAEIRMQAAKDAYVPSGHAIGLVHEGNIASLQSRLIEKRNALRRNGLDEADVNTLVADDLREIRAATIAYEEAKGGFTPAQIRAERALAPHITSDAREMKLSEYRAHLEKTITDKAVVDELTSLYDAPHEAADETELSARYNSGMTSTSVSAYMPFSNKHLLEMAHPMAPKSLVSPALAGPTATSGALTAPAALQPAFGVATVEGMLAHSAVAGQKRRKRSNPLGSILAAGAPGTTPDMAAVPGIAGGGPPGDVVEHFRRPTAVDPALLAANAALGAVNPMGGHAGAGAADAALAGRTPVSAGGPFGAGAGAGSPVVNRALDQAFDIAAVSSDAAADPAGEGHGNNVQGAGGGGGGGGGADYVLPSGVPRYAPGTKYPETLRRKLMKEEFEKVNGRAYHAADRGTKNAWRAHYGLPQVAEGAASPAMPPAGSLRPR